MQHADIQNEMQAMLAIAMRRYKKAYGTASFAAYVLPPLLLIGAVGLALLMWIKGVDSLDTSAIWAFAIALFLHLGYAFRCFYDAKERASEIENIVASVRSFGFKVVHNPVHNDQISPGLQIVKANHPDQEIKTRWGRWDSLAQFDEN